MIKSQHRKIVIATSVSILVAWFFYLLASPESAHALTITPIYRVLETADPIKKVWLNVRNMVNVIIIAALIFIAFANILRINLNNYAIKKFLPALIFGVIAANFSYFVCQFMVDLANVAMSLLMNGAAGSANANVQDIGVAGAFDFTTISIDPNNLWKTFIYVLAEFAGAVVIFILAFLFIIRNYIIMFLVALSPLAFMATVLPETKTVFKQWTSWFFKWTFMPIVSLFWLWLGGMWYSSGLGVTKPEPGGDFNAYFVALVFAGVCYYLAITTPFKMGGAQMAMWSNMGKRALGLAGTVTGARALWNYNQAKYGTLWRARAAEFQTRFKDITGIGSGLDQAKKRLEIAEGNRKAVSEQGAAAYVRRNARRLALDEMRNANRSTSDFAMKMARQGLIQDAEEYADPDRGRARLNLFGREFLRRPDGRLLRRVERMRSDLQQGMMEGETADNVMKTFDNEMRIRLLWTGGENGELRRNAHDEVIGEGEDRRRFESERAYRNRTRRELEARNQFMTDWAHYNWQQQKSSSEAGKLAEKLWNSVALDRYSLSRSQEMLNTARENLEALQKIEDLLAAQNRGEQINQGELNNARGRLMGLGHKESDLNDPTYRGQLMDTLQTGYTKAMENFQKRTSRFSGNQEIPIHLRDMVTRGQNGQISVQVMGGLEFKRSSKIIEGEIVSGGVERYMNTNTPHEMANALLYENPSIISQRNLNAVLTENYGDLSPDDVEGAAEFRHAFSRMMSTQRGAEVMAPALLQKVTQLDNRAALAEVARNVNENLDRMIAGAAKDEIKRALEGLKIDHRASSSQQISNGLNGLLNVVEGGQIKRQHATRIVSFTQDAVRNLIEKGGSLGGIQ